MKRSNFILKKYNWPERTTLDGIDFSEIERKIGFELPSDYKSFLSGYIGHGTKIGEEYIKLWDKNDLLSFNGEYEIIGNLSGIIGIGDNGAGELIGIEKLDDGKLRIALTPFIDMDKRYNVDIGESFADFLIRLDNGKKWFTP